MSFLDRELSWCAGRTVRELLVVAGGTAIVIAEVVRPGPVDIGNLAVYLLATLLLLLRFFAARAAAVGACIGAIVQQWPHLRHGEVTLETLALLPLAGIALLASSDLVDRFERAPSRLRWLPNPWASFTAAETRSLRWAAYAAGALAGLLDHTLQLVTRTAQLHGMTAPWWPRIAMVVLVGALALLCLGRAVGLLIVWLAAVVVAVLVAPLAWQAEPLLQRGDTLAPLYQYAAPYLLPVLLLAVAAALLTTPAVARLLARTLRSP
ncbi:hypothetical protein [Nannocystis sp.]|uniref:hypothetical protein n=1 Tax=Nannocystis sp. TaxID=1962667 RepID=UPI0025F800C9|nr:hypothetical protein [Nannocystis sp.]MBK7829179.1 hypothetical protein [Nannocystis sp.]